MSDTINLNMLKAVYDKRAILLVFVILLASFLRLNNLHKVPTSLFGDELDVGYHAYSIYKTGKDYSGNPWPLHFQSLAEWRTPLYLYSSVPTVALFGISPLGVRLPAAIFGILGVWAIYFLTKELTKDRWLPLIAAFMLAISPWHIQYSRAAFEVTQMLFFLIIGLWLFFVALRKEGKYLWISCASLALMPWIYSTAKVFSVMLLAILSLLWFKKIIQFSKRNLLLGLLALVIIGGPIAYSTVFGGGTARFNYISVFTDPTIEPEVGTNRMVDAAMSGDLIEGYSPRFEDKLFHNKVTFWVENIERNFIQSLSYDFLFNEGDPNLRHSPKHIGQFFRIDLVVLTLGVIFFFSQFKDKKMRFLVAFWILAGIIPSALTRDGGNHATRLILILPPLVLLSSYGLRNLTLLKNKSLALVLTGGYLALLLISFIFYQHQYWVHNPWETERWWHGGWKESIKAIRDNESGFDKVVISTADEPPWIFFAAWYPYDPASWHKGYPFQKTMLSGFGEVSYIDKYYFGSPSDNKGLYDWGKVLSSDTLYLATAKEVRVNLIQEPERTPGDLKLIQAIAFPSGEPAYYLFAKK